MNLNFREMDISKWISKTLKIVILPILLVLVHAAPAQLDDSSETEKDKKQKSSEQVNFKFDQYVMVTLKSGEEVPARITSVKSKKQYWIRMIGGNKKGLVHRKHMREMSPDEVKKMRRQSREPKTR